MPTTTSPRSRTRSRKAPKRHTLTTSVVPGSGASVNANLPSHVVSHLKAYLSNRSAFSGETWYHEPPNRFHTKFVGNVDSLNASLTNEVTSILGIRPKMMSMSNTSIRMQWTEEAIRPRRLDLHPPLLVICETIRPIRQC